MEQTVLKKTTKPYSPEFRERAVRLAMEHRNQHQSETAALVAIAGRLGCSPGSLRVWIRHAQRNGGARQGHSVLEKENHAGLGAPELSRNQVISETTFYDWRLSPGNSEVSVAKRLKQLEDENARLKKLLAESVMDVAALREMLERKF